MAIESAAADAFEKVGFVERPGGVYERPATSDVFDWLGMPVTSRGGVVSASLYIGLRDVRVSDALVRFVRGDGSLEHAATAATNIGSICDHPGSWTLTSEQRGGWLSFMAAGLVIQRSRKSLSRTDHLMSVSQSSIRFQSGSIRG